MRPALTMLFLLIVITGFSQSLEKGIKFWEEKKYTQAKELLKSIKKDNKDFAEAQFYLGRIAYDEKDYETAEEIFEVAIDVNAKVATYHNWYGNAIASQMDDANFLRQAMLAPKMKSAWEKAASLDSRAIEPRESLVQYYVQAPAIAGGSIDKAIEMAKEIIKINPAAGHLRLGNVYSHEKDFQKAEQEFIAMANADPAYASGLGNFYMNQKNYDKAFQLFEEQLKRNPEDMMAVYQIGKTSALSGQRLAQGEASLKKYLNYQPQKNEPSHAGATMRLAQIKEKSGKKDEARVLFAKALKEDASLKEAKEGLERVSK